MTVDNVPADVETQTVLPDPGTEKVEILCNFQFDNHECLAIKLAEDSGIPAELPVRDCDSLTEIVRFKVNGCDCAIVMKALNQETDELNLSIVLTARELQIATLVALGCLNKQVADKLHISEWTVATYCGGYLPN